MSDIERLQRALEYTFEDRKLLELALCHRSVGGSNNERLEFLGDSILNHLIAEYLYHNFPKLREGDLSRMRAALVKGETLALVASDIDLGSYLELGSGERKSGGHRRSSILADALEAVLGAILLDGGVEECRQCIHRLFEERLQGMSQETVSKDAKTRLQEYLQGRGYPLPDYQLIDVSGEAHAQHFLVGCQLEKPKVDLRGEGSSRRKAEQHAAEMVLQAILGKTVTSDG
jgi:ribonuclease III